MNVLYHTTESIYCSQSRDGHSFVVCFLCVVSTIIKFIREIMIIFFRILYARIQRGRGAGGLDATEKLQQYRFLAILVP